MMENIILHERTVICYRSELYDGIIIDGTKLGHHNVIKECSQIFTGAVFGKNETIGKFTIVHLGTIIKHRIQVCEGVVIGAGSVVLQNINDGSLVAKKPGRISIENFYNEEKIQN